MATTTERIISIELPQITASDVQQRNAGYPLTDAAAQAVADVFNTRWLDQVWAAFEDTGAVVTVERRDTVFVDAEVGDTDEAIDRIHRLADALWESDIWDAVSPCVYCTSYVCHADNEPVPALDDDEEWERMAADHDADCEWIATRAHQIEA